MDTQELAKRINHCIDELIKLRIEATGGSVIPQRAYDRSAKGLCVFDGEPIEGRTIRGCCEKHHKQLSRMVKDGTHSELELMRIGWLLPASPGGRASKDGEISEQVNSSLVAEAIEKYGVDLDKNPAKTQQIEKKKTTPK